MKIRFFGSSNCRDCLQFFILLNKMQVDYEYIDALDESDDMQRICDDQNVSQLPHIQFIENENVVINHIGAITEKEFIAYLKKYFPNY